MSIIFLNIQKNKLLAYFITSSFLGKIIAHTKYSNKPVPAQQISAAQSNLTIVGSTSKYSANPAHTPHIILLSSVYIIFFYPYYHFLIFIISSYCEFPTKKLEFLSCFLKLSLTLSSS